jgi:hypothetical protein
MQKQNILKLYPSATPQMHTAPLRKNNYWRKS